MQCPEINPDGQRCGLVEGHTGVHQVTAPTQWGPPIPAPSETEAGARKAGRGTRWWLKAAGVVVVALLIVSAISAASKPTLSDPTGSDRPAAAATSTPADEPVEGSPSPTVSVTPVAAAFTDIVVTGKARKVVKFEIPAETAAIAVVTHKGTSNFIVHTVGADGEPVAGLVNEIGNYSGTVFFNTDASQHAVAFEVDADGAWTITVKPVTAAPTWDPSAPLAGKGDGVYIVSPASSGLVTLDLTFKATPISSSTALAPMVAKESLMRSATSTARSSCRTARFCWRSSPMGARGRLPQDDHWEGSHGPGKRGRQEGDCRVGMGRQCPAAHR
jgi:hypothetical protein